MTWYCGAATGNDSPREPPPNVHTLWDCYFKYLRDSRGRGRKPPWTPWRKLAHSLYGQSSFWRNVFWEKDQSVFFWSWPAGRNFNWDVGFTIAVFYLRQQLVSKLWIGRNLVLKTPSPRINTYTKTERNRSSKYLSSNLIYLSVLLWKRCHLPYEARFAKYDF